MKDKSSKTAIILCSALLGLIAAVNIIMPDREYSEGENRALSQWPEFSLEALFNREDPWTERFEEYFSDQFYLRDKWVSLKAAAEKLAGKKENDGVYFARDALIEKPEKDAASRINVKSINAFAQSAKAPVYFAIIPNSICINAEKLPRYAFDGAQEQFIKNVYAQTEALEICELTPALKKHEGEYLYYRTDHHPTSLGAYYIYRELAGMLGFAPNELQSYQRQVVSRNFNGTMRAKSGAWWVEPDEIEIFTLPGESYSLTSYESENKAGTTDSLYLWDKLDSRDQYTVFLGGNRPRLMISSNREEAEEKLLIVKDSFSHCIAPFLADHFSEIHLIDLRYFRSDIAEYISLQGIDKVLILYSAENFQTDKNLVFLNR